MGQDKPRPDYNIASSPHVSCNGRIPDNSSTITTIPTMTDDIQNMLLTKLQTHKRWSKGKEVERGRRGAILALRNQKTRGGKPLPERTIAKELQIPKSTIHNIIAHNRQLIAENSILESPMSEVNLVSFSRSGRPPRFTASMKLEVITTAT